MTDTPNPTPQRDLTDRLLSLALLAPSGVAKSRLAHAASLLAVWPDAKPARDGLKDQVALIAQEVAALWLTDTDAFSGGVVEAINTALSDLTSRDPAPSARPPVPPAAAPSVSEE